MAKNKNPFTKGRNYLWGLVAVTIFMIAFFSSQITQNEIGSLDINQITNDIEAETIVICQQSGLPQVDVELCKNTITGALATARASVSLEIEENIGFPINLFFQPSTTTLALVVIILFSLGFGISTLIRRK